MIDHRKIEDAIDSYFKNTPTVKIIENLDRLSADREKDLDRENINHKTANNKDSIIGNLVRFEEVSPANQDAAFLAVSIEQLAAPLSLPLYEGYDDLDEMWLTFLTLPSGETVTLMEYLHSPQPGVCISVDAKIQNIPQIVFDSCLQLQVLREEVIWFHPDWQEEIDRLYAEHGAIENRTESSQAKELPQQNQYEPIDCFKHALRIYTKRKKPQYWAMLQHNLGLAYFNRFQGDLRSNLKISIKCFEKSLEIYTQEKFPDKWNMNQHDLKKSQQSLDSFESIQKQRLVQDIISRPILDRQLKGANLIGANLIGVKLIRANLCNAKLGGADMSNTNLGGANLSNAKLGGANLSRANLSCVNMSGSNLNGADLIDADLIDANLSCADLSNASLSGANLDKADLSGAKLTGANLQGANVKNAQFKFSSGISKAMKQDLIARGAIFEDTPGDRSESKDLVPR
jgi:uncharacterized protein YjbI with pentapeptide repeats